MGFINTLLVSGYFIGRNAGNYNVERVYEPYINRGLFTVSGVDTQVSLETDIGLALNVIWTHTLDNSTRETPFGSVIDCAGTFGLGGIDFGVTDVTDASVYDLFGRAYTLSFSLQY